MATSLMRRWSRRSSPRVSIKRALVLELQAGSRICGGRRCAHPHPHVARRIASHFDNTVALAQPGKLFVLARELLLVIIGWITPTTYHLVKANLSTAGVNQFSSATARLELLQFLRNGDLSRILLSTFHSN